MTVRSSWLLVLMVNWSTSQYSHWYICANQAQLILVTVGQARAEAETEERGDNADSDATWYRDFSFSHRPSNVVVRSDDRSGCHTRAHTFVKIVVGNFERHDGCKPRWNELRNICYARDIDVNRKKYIERKSNFTRCRNISNVKQAIINSISIIWDFIWQQSECVSFALFCRLFFIYNNDCNVFYLRQSTDNCYATFTSLYRSWLICNPPN